MSTGQVAASLHIDSGSTAILRLDTVCRGSVTVITVSGELDLSTVHLLDEIIGHLVQERPARVVLDTADVTFFCADGLRALIRARDAVAAAGGQLMLRNPSPAALRVFTITQTAHLFELDDGAAG